MCGPSSSAHVEASQLSTSLFRNRAPRQDGPTMAALAAASASSLLACPSSSFPRSSLGATRPFLGRPVKLSFSHSGSVHFSPLLARAATTTEETTTTTITTDSTTPPEASVQAEELFADLKAKWDSIENKSTVLTYAGGALVALWLSASIVGAVNSVPLLPKILELVGLGYTGWFVYRYLLFKESRKELAADIEELKSKITGARDE